MYEIAIIGAGASGIEAAKRAVDVQKKTVLIDFDERAFGGTCLNRGCIPTKLYLHHSAREKDSVRLFQNKNTVVDSIKQGALRFLQKQGVDIIWGKASFRDEHTLRAGAEEIRARHIIIATGSTPKDFLGVDNKKVFFAENLFSLPDLPQKFLIVGGGAIGLEFASLLHSLNRDVTVLEKEPRILLGFEETVVGRITSLLKRSGITIETSADVHDWNLEDFDMVLLAAGRTPQTAGLDLENVHIKTNSDGMILIDEACRTSCTHVYACGDAASQKMYAYIGEYQARVCVDNICGKGTAYSFEGIPEGIFTIPQVAQVGLQEAEAKEKGITCRILKTHFAPYSSAAVYDDTTGYLKILVDENDRIRGASLISRNACDLISHFAFAIRNNLTRKALAESIFIHPTLSEILSHLARQA